MSYSLRVQRRRGLAALVALAALLLAPAAAAEIYKCAARDGSPLYQNFPCDIDSLGSLPSNRAVATKSSTPGMLGTQGLVNVASMVKPTPTGEPRIGMTVDEVRALLGEPEEVVEDEPARGRVSIWRYADGRTVQFDNKHRVSAVER